MKPAECEPLAKNLCGIGVAVGAAIFARGCYLAWPPLGWMVAGICISMLWLAVYTELDSK